MAVTSVQANTAPSALTVNTESTLESPSITAAGVYVLVIDAVNMANSDVLEVRIKTKGVTTTLQLSYFATYANVQTELNKYSVPVPNEGSQISFSLKQTAGTGRVVPWRILTL